LFCKREQKGEKVKMLKANISMVLGIMTLTLAANAQTNNSDVVADIGGHKFTMAEVEQKESARLLQARNQYYQAQKTALNLFIEEQLLEQKANAEHLTVDQLIQRDIASHITDPTEDQMKVYYEGLGTDDPYEKVRPQILSHIHDLRVAKARSEYIKNLKSQTSIAVTFFPPGMELEVKGSPVLGAKNAPVTLVEYADYECPYCQQVYPALRKLEHDFDGKLSVVFKDCPLPMHSHARKAAEAAMCAGSQGKFWEYHNILFETSGKLETSQLKEDAKTLGLNTGEFDKCLDSGAEAAKVQKGVEEAQELGLTGTPSFFINGHFYSGAMKYEALREVVEQELAAASQNHQLKASN
jgi:protein-disulfide isomerase